ncbi:hypothetical protein CPZ06_09995 [Lactobacillus acidophilus]|nr:hypothetical protein CPZ06_09995 [Lactobacillus acidophilus]
MGARRQRPGEGLPHPRQQSAQRGRYGRAGKAGGMNFYDQALILTYGSVAALLCIVAWDLHAKRRLRLVAVRRKALDDAYDALASAEDIAGRAVDNMLNEPPSPSRDSHIERCKQRAYFYGRAKSFVASIPVDRL